MSPECTALGKPISGGGYDLFMTLKSVESVIELLSQHGNSQYGGEAVTQAEHALQSGLIARNKGHALTLIAACLLHDIGHLLHHLPDDAPDQGIDDFHEELGAGWLGQNFSPETVEPVRLHVAAKRYLCSKELGYLEGLSGPSLLSLELQGGPMSVSEMTDFENNTYFESAIALRRIDEEAKIPGLATPSPSDFKLELVASLKSKV